MEREREREHEMSNAIYTNHRVLMVPVHQLYLKL